MKDNREKIIEAIYDQYGFMLRGRESVVEEARKKIEGIIKLAGERWEQCKDRAIWHQQSTNVTHLIYNFLNFMVGNTRSYDLGTEAGQQIQIAMETRMAVQKKLKDVEGVEVVFAELKK